MIGRAEPHGEVIRRDEFAVDADRAVGIHLADQPAPQLDRTKAGSEHAGEGAFDELLDATFEPSGAHGGHDSWAIRSGHRGPDRAVRRDERIGELIG